MREWHKRNLVLRKAMDEGKEEECLAQLQNFLVISPAFKFLWGKGAEKSKSKSKSNQNPIMLC